MPNGKHFLFELGGEELPPKTLLRLSNALLKNVTQGLQEAGLSFSSSKAYATPRRLAVLIENLAEIQADLTIEKRGPTLQAAFNADGAPTKAAEGFASSCGTTVDKLLHLKTDKGEWLSFTQQEQGQPTVNLLPGIIQQSIANLPIAKRMRWGSFTTEFVRPVHWVVMLFGTEVVSAEILGLQVGRESRGHRFHAPGVLTIDKPEQYEELLRDQGRVYVDFETRQEQIKVLAQQAAQAVNGIAHIEQDLLEEVAALSEWPVPVTGGFDPRFLILPAEVLITTMQTNQKYFPVKSADGKLLPYFITFSNIESTNPISIKQGNERVIVPRLSDAEFFWKQDRKQTLAQYTANLTNIIFQQQLGTLADKTQRVVKLAEHIAQLLHEDVTLAKRAAELAKADLMTNMVGEFANLQGTMGRYYALADQEPEAVAIALEEYYYPKQSGGELPTGKTGQILALADKLDTLTGIFSAGLIPTGDKDPYALRRAALGILRIVIEKQLQLNIVELIDIALGQFTHSFDKSATKTQVVEFVFDRLKGYSLDQGFSADEFDAVISVTPSEPLDFMQRLQAVKNFRSLPEAESLAGANKRIRNILKKSTAASGSSITALKEPQELLLHEKANQSAAAIQPLLVKRDYQGALNVLAQLKGPVDDFFDHVMVNSDDPVLRSNRLALLDLLSNQFLQIADISKLQD